MTLKEEAKRLCARLACCAPRRPRRRMRREVGASLVGGRPEAMLYDELWSPHLDSHCKTCLACYAARCLGQTSRNCRAPPLPSHFTL